MCRSIPLPDSQAPARLRYARLYPAAILLMSGLLAVAPTTAGGVYKWVDEKGNVHYGDRPPSGVTPKEVELEDRPAPTATDTRRREKTRRLLNAIESERKREKEASAREQARAAQRERNCALARRRAEILERANSISITGDDGERTYLNDEDRAAALAQAKKLVREWC